MDNSIIQADFQLIDNYISEFSLKVFEKIQPTTELGINANIGFGILNINEKEMIGQIELRYDVDIIDNSNKNIAKIIIVMNALFKGSETLKKIDFEEMLKINGATTLSHLCRAYIHSATAQSGMPTVVMPLINFYEFFENANKPKNKKE